MAMFRRVAKWIRKFLPSFGKRKYELHIHTDCDELVRLIGWKYGEDNLRVMSMREEQLDVLNQPSGQLDSNEVVPNCDLNKSSFSDYITTDNFDYGIDKVPAGLEEHVAINNIIKSLRDEDIMEELSQSSGWDNQLDSNEVVSSCDLMSSLNNSITTNNVAYVIDSVSFELEECVAIDNVPEDIKEELSQLSGWDTQLDSNEFESSCDLTSSPGVLITDDVTLDGTECVTINNVNTIGEEDCMEVVNQPGGQLDSNEVTDTVSSCEEQTSPSNSTTVLDVASDNLPTEMEDALSNPSTSPTCNIINKQFKSDEVVPPSEEQDITWSTRLDSRQDCSEELNSYMEIHKQTKKSSQNRQSITTRMAKSFDDERVCTMYLSDIKFWRKFNEDTNRCTKPPKSIKIKQLIEKLAVLKARSPEEENCLIAIEKYKQYRETIIKNFSMY